MNENNETRRGCGFWIVRIAGMVIAVIVVLLVIGCAVESGAHDRAMEQYPAPGEMVEVDGRMMHIQCAGEGSPTVILDAGQGGWSIDWGPIFARSAKKHASALMTAPGMDGAKRLTMPARRTTSHVTSMRCWTLPESRGRMW